MVIVFGSINLDLIFNLPRLPSPGETVLGPSTRIEPGGKGANQAVAAGRDGADVIMVGSVGRDALADGALALLRETNVNLDRVQAVQASTGCAAIAVNPAGENAIAVGSGANLSTRASQLDDPLLGPATTLVAQMEVPAAATAEAIARVRAAGGRAILNLAPAAELPEAALRAVDVLVVNATEGAWLAGHLACDATAAGLRDRLGGIAVVLTRGSAGADIASPDATWHQPAAPVTNPPPATVSSASSRTGWTRANPCAPPCIGQASPPPCAAPVTAARAASQPPRKPTRLTRVEWHPISRR